MKWIVVGIFVWREAAAETRGLRLSLERRENSTQEQKKQMEPRETVRLNFSFLFADTAEGALVGYFYWPISVTHVQTHILALPVS